MSAYQSGNYYLIPHHLLLLSNSECAHSMVLCSITPCFQNIEQKREDINIKNIVIKIVDSFTTKKKIATKLLHPSGLVIFIYCMWTSFIVVDRCTQERTKAMCLLSQLQ